MSFPEAGESPPILPQRRWWWREGFAMGVMLFIAMAWWCWPVSEKRLLGKAARSLEAKEFGRAEQFCLRVLRKHSGSIEALSLAADAAQRDGRGETALEYLRQAVHFVPRNGGDADTKASKLCGRCGKLALELGRLRDGEDFLSQALALDSLNKDARTTLIYVLRIEGRNWEAREWIHRQFARGVFSPDELFLAGTTNWIWIDSRDTRFLAFCQKSVPDDPLPNLALARQALNREEVTSAERILRAIAEKHSSLSEAQASLGTALLQRGNEAELSKWVERQTSNRPVTDHPEYWFLQGRLLAGQGDTRGAVSCFAEALRRQSDHRGACSQLARLLAELGAAELADAAAGRSRQLARLEDILREVQSSPALTEELAELLLSMNRKWEALGWAKTTLARQPNAAWAGTMVGQLQADITPELPLAPVSDLEEKLLAKYPAASSLTETTVARTISSTDRIASTNSVVPTFNDVARQTGIEFRFDNGHDPRANRAFMFEFSGGGVAVLDFDLDEWPDLYLVQAGRWPQRGTSTNATDRLYRHRGLPEPGQTGGYVDVTANAGVTESGFGQSATVGDFDNDGFPDLYVMNIGANRLLHNNGDGTFTDVTAETDTAGNAWSLGAAFADFDRDGLADLYVVNYLAGDVLTRSCLNRGRPVQCPPASFPAEQDRFYLNRQDGRFEDATARGGVERPEGKGMGLVVADMNDDGELDLFVANDTTPNFLFLNRRASGNEAPLFDEQGVLAGVAFDDRGQPQSSMGCAWGDADGDGLPDLFVTNYLREPNNLFRCTGVAMSFLDGARQARLHEPSLDVMGWGTQFFDADGDGDLDVIVANGHLEDYSDEGVPYRMRTQLFLNDGTGRFDEADPKRVGPHFDREVLGRAVARLDWNRDGRDDVAMTHADAPFALLGNTTAQAGHALTLSLRGTTSARDAIGATIELHAGSQRLVRQLTAGDGFAASNERKLVIGLGSATQVDQLQIRWPSGLKQTFQNLPAHHEHRLIEGRPHPTRIALE